MMEILDLAGLGKRFREERAQWDDKTLAVCLILIPEAINRLENGGINPDSFLLFKMAACGLDVQYILTGVRSCNWYEVAAKLSHFEALEAA